MDALETQIDDVLTSLLELQKIGASSYGVKHLLNLFIEAERLGINVSNLVNEEILKVKNGASNACASSRPSIMSAPPPSPSSVPLETDFSVLALSLSDEEDPLILETNEPDENSDGIVIEENRSLNETSDDAADEGEHEADFACDELTDACSGEFTVVEKPKKKNKNRSDAIFNEGFDNREYLGRIVRYNGLFGEFCVQGLNESLWFSGQELVDFYPTVQLFQLHPYLFKCKKGMNFDSKKGIYRPCAIRIETVKKL